MRLLVAVIDVAVKATMAVVAALLCEPSGEYHIMPAGHSHLFPHNVFTTIILNFTIMYTATSAGFSSVRWL